MNVTDNHFGGDFFLLNKESSCLEISAELSFQDRESVFGMLSFSIFFIIELAGHFLTVSTADVFVIPGTDWNDGLSTKILPDIPVKVFRIVSFVHDITIRLSDLVTLSE